MRKSAAEEGVRARARARGHATIIGLMMNTISPRTRWRPACQAHILSTRGGNGATCCSRPRWRPPLAPRCTRTPQHIHPRESIQENFSERLIPQRPQNKACEEYKGCEFNGNTRRGILFSFKSARGTGVNNSFPLAQGTSHCHRLTSARTGRWASYCL